MTNIPTVKRTKNVRWALIDMIDYYSHMPIYTNYGKARVVKTDHSKDLITIETLKEGLVKTTTPNRCKLLLKPLNLIRGIELETVANLALNSQGFTFSSTRQSNQIVCTGEKYIVSFVFRPEFGVKVSTIDGQSLTVKNLGYITSFLAKRGYDLFNLLRTSYARFFKS
jgi:hypothetical protein